MTQEEIYKLHQKYAEGEKQKELLDLVWEHSLIVRDIAMQLADNLIRQGIKIDKDLVEIGALIHDIGCYDYYKKVNDMPYILHGVRGYEILKSEGVDEEIARIATVHLGVGIVKENIVVSNLPLEHKNFIPITLEEELVAYSDNFHSKKGPKFMTFDEAKEKLAGLWSESPIIFERFREKFGEPEIKQMSKF
jgi:uncharacterized protein